MEDPFTAYVPGEVTQVPRMTNVHPKFLENHLGIMAFSFLHQDFARTVGNPFTAYVPGEVTQVSRMTDLHPKFLEKSPR